MLALYYLYSKMEVNAYNLKLWPIYTKGLTLWKGTKKTKRSAEKQRKL